MVEERKKEVEEEEEKEKKISGKSSELDWWK